MMVERMRAGAAAVAALALAACGGGEAKETDAGASAYVRTINVAVEPVTPGPFADVVRLVGLAEAERDVTVAAEESGVIRALLADKGERVRAGQPIARIDDAVLAAQAEQARAEAALARETYERQRRLWEDEKIGTELTYLQAKYRAETAAASARALEARLDRTTVRAPIGGVLDARPVEVGSMVVPGAAIARIIDADPIRVVGGVPERFAPDIRAGAAAEIAFDALGGRVFAGTVHFVGSAVDGQNRTFPVEVRIPNPDGLIKAGMVANVQLARQTFERAIAVPQETLQRLEDGYAVFVAVDRDGQTIAEARRVQLGPARQGRIVVTSGLEAGERLIIVGHKDLAAGDVLRIIDAAPGGER